MTWLYLLFFLSGFPALLYQLIWQRVLFTIYGVNIESVTLVVSAFMLGLGLGSLGGGRISKIPGVPVLALFGAAEIGIGLFGLISLPLFHWTADHTVHLPQWMVGVLSFLLLLLPTVLMGGTLPLLTTHLVRRNGNVGSSVGVLYFVNTLGSAAACFAAAWYLMRNLGETRICHLAAAINITIGSAMLLRWIARGRKEDDPSRATEMRPSAAAPAGGGMIPFGTAALVAGLAGAVALGYEIVWYRVYSYATGGRASAFAMLLGYYLVGVAFGSFVAKFISARVDPDDSRGRVIISGFVVLANLAAFLVAPFVAYCVGGRGMRFSYPSVAASTMLLGAIFPLVCHVSVKADHLAGSRLSYLYLSNIVGSTLGSLGVGYILMDVLPIGTVCMLLGVIGMVLGGALLIGGGRKAAGVAVAAAMSALVVAATGRAYDRFYERLHFKAFYDGHRYKHLIENRSGVIAVDVDDAIYGGGIYDGVFNTSPINDRNGAFRPYSISLWHPAPKRVLMIGLSSGSWAQIVAHHPQVEKLKIVEINPGYVQLIGGYPAVSSLLRNPKVDIVIDDGRRWLVRNPQERFDLVIMNTTFNWRAHITNLVSSEFLRLVRGHLLPGGVFFYNTTESKEVQRTGLTEFPYGFLVRNALAVSDSPLELNIPRWRDVLVNYKVDGVPVFDLSNPEHQKRLDFLTSYTLNDTSRTESVQDRNKILADSKGMRIITDDNMGTEWLR